MTHLAFWLLLITSTVLFLGAFVYFISAWLDLRRSQKLGDLFTRHKLRQLQRRKPHDVHR